MFGYDWVGDIIEICMNIFFCYCSFRFGIGGVDVVLGVEGIFIVKIW